MSRNKTIHKERRRRGITQADAALELSALAGYAIPGTQVSRWENGSRPRPLAARLIADWLKHSKRKKKK